MSWLSSWLKGEAKNKSTSSTQRDPWAPTVDSLKGYIGKIDDLYNGGAPQISPYEQYGYDQLKSAAAPSDSMNAALGENAKTAGGEYLDIDSNPYLQDIATRVGGMAMSSINSVFGGRGRSGSGLHAKLGGEGVGNALTDLFGKEYDAERNRMGQAVGMAPQLEAGKLLGPAALIQAGQSISARPFDIAAQQGGILGGIAGLGGTSNTQATTKQSSGSSSILGRIGDYFGNKLFPSG